MGLRLSMQRLSITTSVFVPDYARYEVYSIQPFVIQFISGLLQVKSVALRGYTNESDSNNATFSCSNKSNRHYALSSCSNKGNLHDTPFPRNNLCEGYGTPYPAPMQAIATIHRVFLTNKSYHHYSGFSSKNTNGGHYTRFPRSIKSTHDMN